MDKYQERLSFRAKSNSIETKNNKYILNINAIQEIQLLNRAQGKQLQIPVLNNKNIDNILLLVHTTILKSIKRFPRLKNFVNKEGRAEYLKEIFSKVKLSYKSKKDQTKPN